MLTYPVWYEQRTGLTAVRCGLPLLFAVSAPLQFSCGNFSRPKESAPYRRVSLWMLSASCPFRHRRLLVPPIPARKDEMSNDRKSMDL